MSDIHMRKGKLRVSFYALSPEAKLYFKIHFMDVQNIGGDLCIVRNVDVGDEMKKDFQLQGLEVEEK